MASEEEDSTTDWPAGELNSSSPPYSITPPDFSSTELSNAIAEVGWGLLSWEILEEEDVEEDDMEEEEEEEEDTNSSSARLELLEEGSIVIVEVSDRGWKIIGVDGLVNDCTLNASTLQGKYYETLDHLLSSVSPAFENRRIKLLTDSLENISVRRSWGEIEE